MHTMKSTLFWAALFATVMTCLGHAVKLKHPVHDKAEAAVGSVAKLDADEDVATRHRMDKDANDIKSHNELDTDDVERSLKAGKSGAGKTEQLIDLLIKLYDFEYKALKAAELSDSQREEDVAAKESPAVKPEERVPAIDAIADKEQWHPHHDDDDDDDDDSDSDSDSDDDDGNNKPAGTEQPTKDEEPNADLTDELIKETVKHKHPERSGKFSQKLKEAELALKRLDEVESELEAEMESMKKYEK